jgi:hypothetical protein
MDEIEYQFLYHLFFNDFEIAVAVFIAEPYNINSRFEVIQVNADIAFFLINY